MGLRARRSVLHNHTQLALPTIPSSLCVRYRAAARCPVPLAERQRAGSSAHAHATTRPSQGPGTPPPPPPIGRTAQAPLGLAPQSAASAPAALGASDAQLHSPMGAAGLGPGSGMWGLLPPAVQMHLTMQLRAEAGQAGGPQGPDTQSALQQLLLQHQQQQEQQAVALRQLLLQQQLQAHMEQPSHEQQQQQKQAAQQQAQQQRPPMPPGFGAAASAAPGSGPAQPATGGNAGALLLAALQRGAAPAPAPAPAFHPGGLAPQPLPGPYPGAYASGADGAPSLAAGHYAPPLGLAAEGRGAALHGLLGGGHGGDGGGLSAFAQAASQPAAALPPGQWAQPQQAGLFPQPHPHLHPQQQQQPQGVHQFYAQQQQQQTMGQLQAGLGPMAGFPLQPLAPHADPSAAHRASEEEALLQHLLAQLNVNGASQAAVGQSGMPPQHAAGWGGGDPDGGVGRGGAAWSQQLGGWPSGGPPGSQLPGSGGAPAPAAGWGAGQGGLGARGPPPGFGQ
jgi:hypothetical protein